MQNAEYAGFADSFNHLIEPEAAQASRDQAGGARQVIHELGIAVQVVTPRRQLGHHRCNGVLLEHRRGSFCANFIQRTVIVNS